MSAGRQCRDHDLILSSGFLAFARHTGVLAALEERDVKIDAVLGTSSGALVGALWSAGHSAAFIEAELTGHRPITRLRPTLRPWRGLFRLDAMVAYLQELLPPTFADLARPFAVGVIDSEGVYALLSAGSLAHAVAASCAMPYVFQPVKVGSRTYQDGGVQDRLGLSAWRQWRPNRCAIAHQVRRTAGKDVSADLTGITLVETPRSGANFFSLGDVREQVTEARQLALAVLDDRGLSGCQRD